MAASDPHPRSQPPSAAAPECLSAPALLARLDEEIHRAERHDTKLSCLLVAIDVPHEMTPAQSEELLAQTLAYVSTALGRELRRFDRVGRPGERELLIVLPGADGPRGEIVARRVLDRLRTIKVEVGGARSALDVSVGLAAWQEGMSADELLKRTRAAAHLGNGDAVEQLTPS
ncbi:MAG TPA: diguanylate cyclase [Solirubrobacteraceae bacterium]|nr:diguanylate cyclase [Solirubrobacteraceae bacterium]